MDQAHRFLKPIGQDRQPIPLLVRPSPLPNLSKVDTATQLTSSSNFRTVRLALTAVSAELAVTKQLVKAIKAANTGVTKLSAVTTMATTSNNVAAGAAIMEDTNNRPRTSRHVLVDCRLCAAWKASRHTCVTTTFRFLFLFTHHAQSGSKEGRES